MPRPCGCGSQLPAQWDVIVLEPAAWGGPPGVAVMACRAGTPWAPAPPATRTDRFPGRLPGALAAAAAMTLPDTDAHEAEERRIGALAGHLAALVTDTIPDVAILSPAGGLPSIVSMSLLYVNAEQLVDDLTARGFGVHSGSACTSDLKRPSHVLTALGAITHGNLRVSLPPGCPAAEIEDFAAALAQLVERQRTEAGRVMGELLDERGRACPLPIIALGRARRRCPAGTEVTLLADDPVVLTDVPAWCAMVGATIIDQRTEAGTITYRIRL